MVLAGVLLSTNKNKHNIFNYEFIKLGQDIDGEAVGDHSGYSVAISSDGSRLAIGAYGNDDNGSNSGHVRVFELSGTSWNQLGGDIDGEASGDYSGSVALSSDGTIVAIGARYNNGNGENSGHVRVYELSNNDMSWNKLGGDIDGEAEGDRSGHSVALSSNGKTLAIGAPRNDGNGLNSGHVRVFKWNDLSWVQLGQDIDGEEESDESGYSVALSSDGTIVAIGARKNHDNGKTNSGHVRVYELSNNDMSWVQIGEDIGGEAGGDESGFSVALSSDGTRVAIGARYNNGNGTHSGHVRVYELSNNYMSWVQLGGDIDGEALHDQSGWSVALSSDGTRLAIGAPYNDDNDGDSGHVRVYQLSNTSWVQLGEHIVGEGREDNSGYSVALSSDGTRIAIGGVNNDGHVRVYDIVKL